MLNIQAILVYSEIVVLLNLQSLVDAMIIFLPRATKVILNKECQLHFSTIKIL